MILTEQVWNIGAAEGFAVAGLQRHRIAGPLPYTNMTGPKGFKELNVQQDAVKFLAECFFQLKTSNKTKYNLLYETGSPALHISEAPSLNSPTADHLTLLAPIFLGRGSSLRPGSNGSVVT